MFAEVTDIKDNEIELIIREEDISILYVIQHELLKEKGVDFAGVILKHPLTKEYHVRIVTKKKAPMEAIQDASNSAVEYSTDFSNMIKSVLKK